jgi:hypothetical protein
MPRSSARKHNPVEPVGDQTALQQQLPDRGVDLRFAVDSSLTRSVVVLAEPVAQTPSGGRLLQQRPAVLVVFEPGGEGGLRLARIIDPGGRPLGDVPAKQGHHGVLDRGLGALPRGAAHDY